MKTSAAREAPPARAPGWSDPAFARVADVVHVVSGLVFPVNRQASAESGMRRAMSALGIREPAELAQAVEARGDARDALLAELTVGETYFFREASQLDLLRTDVLPALRSTRGANKPLRMWSVGCASGEEPYTLAIMLRELGWTHPSRILGTDIARPRLTAARRGRYTRWSLRGVSPERVQRWFEPRAALFQLDTSILSAVEFSPLNLIADDYPSAATGTIDQDVVLCRNVLIYFDMAAVARIAERLLASLAPDGWLLLGASDPPLSGLVPCEVVMRPGGIAYRRADRDPARPAATLVADGSRAPFSHSATVPTAWSSTPSSLAPPAAVSEEHASQAPTAAAAATAAATPEPEQAEATARRMLQHNSSRAEEWVLLIRALANQGRLRDAEEECVHALDLFRLDPELHVLHATLLNEATRYHQAAQAARRALYLDRRFVLAHMQLGNALAFLGDAERAARAFAFVIRELASVSDDIPVPASDGVRASRLRQIAELRLRRLRGGPAS